MGSHLQYPPHSDAYRLTSISPKMILLTYKSDAHPGNGTIRSFVGPRR